MADQTIQTPHDHQHRKDGRVDEEHEQDLKYSHMLAKETEEISQQYFMSVNFVGTMVSMSLSVVATYFGFAVPAGVVSFINEDIGPSANASLFSIIWTMCCAIGIMLTGRLSDKFGRRYFVLVAGAASIIGGIVACTAPTMDVLIGANVIIGLAGGVYSSLTLFSGELMPHKYKFLGMAGILLPVVVCTGFAAYIGRALVELRNWRWIYYIYLIIIGSAFILQVFVYHPANFHQLHGAQRTRMHELKRVDFGGIFLLVAGLTLFILGVSWGGNPKPWTSGLILGLLISGGVTLIAFGSYEAYTSSPNPFVDLKLFKDIRGFVCLNVISMAAGAMYISLQIIWPQQVVAVYGSASQSWRDSAWMSTTVGWGVWAGIVTVFPFINVIKHIRRQLLVLTLMSVVFTAALSSVDRHQKAHATAFSFLAGYPLGLLDSGLTVVVQLDVEDMDLGMAYAILSAIRTVGGAIFTAVFVAILTSKTKHQLATKVPPAVIKAGLPASSVPALFQAIATQNPEALASVPGMTASIGGVLHDTLADAYAAAFAYVYYAAVAVMLTAVIAALFLKDYDRYLTGHVPRQVYNKADQEIGKVVDQEKKSTGDVPVHLEEANPAKTEILGV